MGLSIVRLSHSYDGKLYIFRDLSFSVEKGEIVALTGPNGSGKTTLLRILCGLLTPSDGQVLLDGLSSSGSMRAFNKKMGWVPAQETGFFSRLSGFDNLLFFASFYGIREREVRIFVDQWREIEPMGRALATPFALCSSGMKRSLLLLRALVHKPDCVLMDEPFAHFDKHVSQAVVEKLKKYSDGARIIFSTHAKEQASLLSARLLSLGEMS